MTEPTQADTDVEENLTDPAIQAARMYGSPSPPTQQPRKGGTLEDPLNEELRRRGMYPSSDAERRQREQTERRISGEEVAEGSSEDLSSADVRQRRMYAQEDAAEPEQDEETEAEPQAEKQETSDTPAELKAEGVDPDVLTAFRTSARDLGIEPHAQQQLLDKVIPAMRERQQAAIAGLREGWVRDAKEHPELTRGGFDANLETARSIIDRFGSDELTELLESSGLGDHPALVRFALRVGRRLGTV